ncbi:MAG: alcohol dehydrogenase catalytic domain-containing protein [Deltaproteobacteria bacterium]|nr:alcohol dehydrogenase catalytic domain-containing protein [Deltaproteobacteria bacterium]MBW2110970.1 alcohol dehydrogenase catalytic domain-containing protein [Deltaproteobacteria bacterium]MBW2351720.1 alcohol dehydrogenase catalytic domain-containing protein [Deltaproteobacteria bacterium]
MKKTRAMVLTGPGKLELQEFILPETGDEDGILKLELIGVCGSDPGIYNGKTRGAPRPYPIILGHEIVGRVERMGPGARKRHGVKEGDRVIVEYAFGCGTCRPCILGRYTLCENFYTYGSMISCKEPPHLFGAYADYLYIHPRAMVHGIGDQISPETAIMICAGLGNAVRWLRTIGDVSIGRSVVIVGPGQQGLSAVIAAKESGAGPIFVVGLSRDHERLEMASRFGAHRVIKGDEEDPVEIISRETRGAMADLVMDATGHPSGATLALSLAGTGATLILPGLYGADTQVPLLLDRVVLGELSLKGVFSHDFPAVEAAIKIAGRGRYPLEHMISHRFPLEKAEEAITLVGGKVPGETPLKVVLDPAL